MRRNQTLTILNSCHRDLRIPSRETLELRLQSHAKLPKLQEVIDEWKFKAQVDNSDLDKCLLEVDSNQPSIDGFVDHLTKRIEDLEGKLRQMYQKHVQVCSILCQQLQKKSVIEQTLRKENIELNKQMRSLMQNMNSIINSLYTSNQNKNNFNVGIKIRAEKENSSPSHIKNCIDRICANGSSKDKKYSRKLRLLSNRGKFMSISSMGCPLSPREHQFPQKSKKKADTIQQTYYEKSQKNAIGENELKSKMILQERNKHINVGRKSKTIQTQLYY